MRLSKKAKITALAVGVLFYGLLTAFMVSMMPFHDGGKMVYALDDAYIYMAMARNLAESGIWGVTTEGFAGTSSSHIWIIFLGAAYKLTGVSEIAPLILNVLFGLASFVVLVSAADDLGFNSKTLFAAIAVFTFCVYPSQMTVIGMETVLLCLLTLCYGWAAIKLLRLAEDEKTGAGLLAGSSIATALLCACRYEALYLVAPLLLVLLLRRRFVDMFVILAAALLPVLAYGLYSMAHGNLFFPNTILLKGRVGFANPIEGILTKQVEVGDTALKQLWLVGSMIMYCVIRMKASSGKAATSLGLVAFTMVAAAVLGIQDALPLVKSLGPSLQELFKPVRPVCAEIIFLTTGATGILALVHLIKTARTKDNSLDSSYALLFDLTILAMVTHLFTARFGWLFRYEAYLLSMACLSFVPILRQFFLTGNNTEKIAKTTKTAMICALSVLAFGILIRTTLSTFITPHHARGVRYQHLEMANFIQKNFPESTIMANDIGAICYFAPNIRLLDLWGLASLEVALARADHRLNEDFLLQYGKERKANIAVLQEYFWRIQGIPKSWYKAGEWHTPPYNGVGEVSFFAVDESLKAKLDNDLSQYPLPEPDSFEPRHELNIEAIRARERERSK